MSGLNEHYESLLLENVSLSNDEDLVSSPQSTVEPTSQHMFEPASLHSFFISESPKEAHISGLSAHYERDDEKQELTESGSVASEDVYVETSPEKKGLHIEAGPDDEADLGSEEVSLQANAVVDPKETQLHEEEDSLLGPPSSFPEASTRATNHESGLELLESRSITISDDQSIDEKVVERRLIALRIHLSRPSALSRLDLFPRESLFARLFREYWELVMEGDVETDARDAMTPSTASVTTLGKRSRQAGAANDIKNNIDEMTSEELKSYIHQLHKRAKTIDGSPSEKRNYRHKTLFRILRWVQPTKKDGRVTKELSPAYFDQPELLQGQGHSERLQCSLPVENMELYLEKNKDVCAIVYHTYIEPSSQELGTKNRGTRKRPHALRVDKSIAPLTQELQDAVETMLESVDGCSETLQTFRSSGELMAPYLFYYHHRTKFGHAMDTFDSSTKAQITVLVDHITQTQGDDWRAADAMIAEGKISPRRMTYLLKPGDTVIHQRDGDYSGWVATSWPSRVSSRISSRSEARRMVMENRDQTDAPDGSFAKVENDKVMVHEWSVDAWQWQFDGAFTRRNALLKWFVQQEMNDYEEEIIGGELSAETTPLVPIGATRMIPLHCCAPDIVDMLRHRGHIFWKCRDRQFVNYSNTDNDVLIGEDRYMIDLKTYRDLHKNNQYDYGMSKRPIQDDLGEDAMKREHPPKEDFELLLPPKIKGYHLLRKKWFDLAVDRISDVVWNKEAFSKIVMDPKAKEIVRALISKQLASERSTDLIVGKGNGLILLLHGGPGTGKTLTAESVAEIAEKPLYRVTCGDVGTKAEDVEKYLESVFHLGKRWGCVVLLDEADVFLEQRDLRDLERNALVSVFLRTLEYYEGILILTSNRVGTFDEAFRSRIQLALHYPPLTQAQRLRIWENFIDRLESFRDGSVNIADLKYHLEDLGNHKMNGREIRNVITTARQYAEYMGMVLTYAQLKDVIDISARFDTYLGELRGGLSQDEIAKDDGIR